MRQRRIGWPRHRAAALAGFLLALAAAGTGPAQQPSPAQAHAIRQACRSDYIEHCSSVPTGGAASLNCLRQNAAQLAPACRQAIGAVGGGQAPPAASAPATPQPHPAEHGPPGEMFREECGPDVRRLCRGVMPGGGRMIGCLVENREALSPACRGALMELRERRP